MQVPGFLWVAILALLPLLIDWLGGDYFAAQSWAPWAILLLGFVAKAMQLYREQVTTVRIIGEPRPSRIRRFLVG